VIIGIGVSEADSSHPSVGAGWLGIPEVWLGFAADATYEVTSGGGDEGLTLEAEDGVIRNGGIVYDTDASSCYAVAAISNPYDVYFDVSSTSLTWERPLRIRLVYKSTGEGEISVRTNQEGQLYYVGAFEVSETTGYAALELVVPSEAEPFNGIRVDVDEFTGEILLDAIQLTSATGDWPPLNPCSS
jgi:hypothetical protein